MAERTTDLRTATHRRLVVRLLVTALRSVFGNTYNRDPQLINLKVTATYPLKQEDYPCVVVEYQPSVNRNAGVGHEEWFMDETNILRKWNHRFIQGDVSFHCFGLSPLDCDLLADALEEVIAFGRLDSALAPFFYTIYGDPNDTTVRMIFSQLMLNSDEVHSGAASASLAPWSPEDQLVYDTSLSTDVRVGLYNAQPNDNWNYVTKASIDSWQSQFFETDTITLPFNDPSLIWTNPFQYEDDAIVFGTAVISSNEQGSRLAPSEFLAPSTTLAPSS